MGAQFVEFCRMAFREFGFAWLPLTLFLAVCGTRERATSAIAQLLVFAVDRARRPCLRA